MAQLQDSLSVLWYLVVETLDVALWAWPVSLAFFALGLLGLLVPKLRRGGSLERRERQLISVSYLIPLAMLTVATVLRYDLYGPPHPNWEAPPDLFGLLLWAPFAIQLCLVLLIAGLAKGRRLVAVTATLPSVWLSLCTLLPGAVAISGVGP